MSGGRNRYRKSGKNTHTNSLALKARAALPRPQRTPARKMFDLWSLSFFSSFNSLSFFRSFSSSTECLKCCVCWRLFPLALYSLWKWSLVYSSYKESPPPLPGTGAQRVAKDPYLEGLGRGSGGCRRLKKAPPPYRVTYNFYFYLKNRLRIITRKKFNYKIY